MLQVVADDTFGIWGDVAFERWYTFWTLQPGGWQYPQQITTTWNGTPHADQTVFTIETNTALDEALFAIPDDTAAAFRKMRDATGAAMAGMRAARLDPSKAIRLTGDVVVFPGSWAVTLIRQPDGIVVLEAPIGSAYSVQVIAAAAAAFPNTPIKAVVTTSDAWPHLGGVREYVARGIPVYALDLNKPILERLVAATYSQTPDALARAPRAPEWRFVSEKTTIGGGETRVDVIPVRGEGSERMLMAHLPALNLLYATDLLQYNRDRTSFFNPVYPAELAAAVAREGITGLDRVWAMHMDPIPWSKVTEALAAIRAR
jgi:glyoxylase-like metal-dependent hydrolase (beta-lactamase superfamily II)